MLRDELLCATSAFVDVVIRIMLFQPEMPAMPELIA